MPSQKPILYSEKYYDDKYEYRHVQIPQELSKLVPRNRLLTEDEWRGLGIQQSKGWIHYMIHEPEPHVLLFRRPHDKDQPPTQEEQFEKERQDEEAAEAAEEVMHA